MSTPRKIATVSGLVGGVAVLCVGAAHAHADGLSGDCRSTAQGGTVCVHKSESQIDKDGVHIIKQAQDCSTSDRPHVVLSEDQLAEGGSVGVGQGADCSNTAKLPKGFEKPHIEF